MKLIHYTDLHARRHWFDAVAREAKQLDVVVVSGDLLDAFPNAKTPLQKQVEWVSAWCLSLPCPLVLCSGNHDYLPADGGLKDGDEDAGWLVKLRRQNRVMVDGDDTVIEGIRFQSWPWIGVGPEVKGDLPTMVVAHVGAAGVPVSCNDLGDAGSLDLEAAGRALPRFSWILSGHIHDPAARHCRLNSLNRAHCCNPGVAPWAAPKPNSVLIDTDRKLAEFRGANGDVELVRYGR